MQALDRYTSLVGHKPPSKSVWDAIKLSSAEQNQKDREHRRQRVLSSLQSTGSGQQHKYFFAINLYNSFDVIPDIFSTLFRVASILGFNNVFVSIYENGSKDQTKALLNILDALLRSVGIRVVIRTSQRTRGAFNHRIEYLAEVRNAALVPLHELRDREGEFFDTIVFMNDILPCVDDLLELIWQSRKQNAGVTCAADYMFHQEIVRITMMTKYIDAHRTCRVHLYSTTIGSLVTLTGPHSRTHRLKESFTTPSPRTGSNITYQSRSSLAGTGLPFLTLRPFIPHPMSSSEWRNWQIKSVPLPSVP